MGIRFLIVDDSDLVRRSLRGILEANSGWEVCAEAADGLTALDLVARFSPDVVILDFQMPGLNGLETARRMIAAAPKLPILLFTQHASEDLERHAQEVGVRAVIPKTSAISMIETIEGLLLI